MGGIMEKGEHRCCNTSSKDRPVNRSALIDSRCLFADRKILHIRHNGELYVLRMTKNGKLILNK